MSTLRPRRVTSTPLLFAVLAMLLGAGGIGRAVPAAEAAAPAEVRIGYFANLTHAQAVLGVASGDFAAAVAPATVSTKLFNAGPSLIEALFAGEIDLGYVGPGPALNGFVKSRGTGLRIVAGAASNGVVVVARPGAGIASLADLKGKRIATPQLGNTQDLAARHYVTKDLGQPNADNVLPVPNAEQATMMTNGEIDAAWAPEPWGAWLVSKAGAKVIAEEKDLWPAKEFMLTCVVTTPEFLARHPDSVRALLGVHRTWTQRLTTDSAKYLPQLGTALNALTGKSLPDDVYTAAFARTRFTDRPLEDTLKTMAQWSYDLGFSRDLADPTGIVDTTILDGLAGGAPAGR